MSITTRSGLARAKARKLTGSDSSITSLVRSSCSPMRALITSGSGPGGLVPTVGPGQLGSGRDGATGMRPALAHQLANGIVLAGRRHRQRQAAARTSAGQAHSFAPNR